MRHVTPRILITLPAVAALLLGSLAPASADNILKNFTIDVAPVYENSTNGDANAPPPPGEVPLGYTNNHPVVNDVRVNYGLRYDFDKHVYITLAHTNVGYNLGRILTLAPNTSFVSGSIYDYTDSATLGYTVGNGIGYHFAYFSHQRSDVTGLCLNQKECPNAQGVQANNPLSIDQIGYNLGFTWDFGPVTRIGKIFTVGADAQFLPRSAFPYSPNVALGGLPGWIGSTMQFPYFITARIPIFYSSTLTPFINYTALPALYHDAAVPEDYRGFVWGITKTFGKYITLNYTNFNLPGCKCITRVPYPDNVRLGFTLLGLDFHTPLGH